MSTNQRWNGAAARRGGLAVTPASGVPGGAGRIDPPPEIRVLIADDHPVALEGLRSLIDRQPGMKVVAEASDGPEAVAQFACHEPDIALLDLRMPGLDGVEAAGAIRSRDPFARVVILTAFAGDEEIYRSLRAGAKAYLLKGVARDVLIDCIRAVHAGNTFLSADVAAKLAGRVGSSDLTDREREVLRAITRGQGNRDIGSELHVTEGTIKVHVYNILTKLGVGSRTEAVTQALRRGIVHLDE